MRFIDIARVQELKASMPDGWSTMLIDSGEIRDGKVWITDEQHREIVRMFKPKRRTVKDIARRVAHGVAASVRERLNIGIAPQEVIDRRMLACGGCGHAVKCGGKTCCGPMVGSLVNVSPTCGCVIHRKTRLASESCPIGHWVAYNAERLERDLADGTVVDP